MTPLTIIPATITFCPDEQQFYLKGVNVPHKYSGMLKFPCKVFASQIKQLLILPQPFKGDIPVHLIDPVWNENGDCLPASIVILPDWLIDVTRICHDLAAPDTIEMNTLLHRYSLPETSPFLLAGNICHFITASLLCQPTQSLDKILTACFQEFGLQLTAHDEPTLIDLIGTINNQYQNIRHCIQNQFPNVPINPENLIIEPTYFCPSVGLQGRPDFLHMRENDSSTDILEIKSSKPPADRNQITYPGHQFQTTLYQIIVSLNHAQHSAGQNFILYAGAKEHSLRLAPFSTDTIHKAIQIRNSIVVQDLLMTSPSGHTQIFRHLKYPVSTTYPPFLETKRQKLANLYHLLSPLEKAYWHYFGAHIHKEHQMSRLGTDLGPGGQSLIWRASDEEKINAARVEKNLLIESFKQNRHSFLLVLSKKTTTNTRIPFRKGDIVILYPDQDTERHRYNLPTHPITRCTVTDSSNTHITVKLKTKQINENFFRLRKNWSLESDALDSSFRQLYHGLVECMAAPHDYRQLFLGIAKPGTHSGLNDFTARNHLTTHQQSIVANALRAKDYYLIWGPPGTGKTSMIISELVLQLLQHDAAPLMLLAYTNRAVDEICQAVLTIEPAFQNLLIRVGSANAASDSSDVQILDVLLRSCTSRKEIKELLHRKRIFAATISSIYHKPELFQILQYNTVIIDEASQVTEPMVAGLLSRFKKWILVGDHLQLPAVSLQRENETLIDDQCLQNAGFYSTQTSFFERLFCQSQKNSWDHAFGMLHEQGRLHKSLLSFPNTQFYQSKLTIPEQCHPLHQESYFLKLPELLSTLANRKLLIDCDQDIQTTPIKSCFHETSLVIKCITILLFLYDFNQTQPGPRSIGIISPFRSQSTHINHQVQLQFPEFSHLVTADTIERYQGATRDIAIISFGVQHSSLLENIQSISSQGLDRKLNVALTRAREQIILIGNVRLLKMKPLYAKLFDEYTILTLVELDQMYAFCTKNNVNKHFLSAHNHLSECSSESSILTIQQS